jgi:hypothetical protein
MRSKFHRANYSVLYAFVLVLLTNTIAHAEVIDSTVSKPKPIGSVIRTVREVYFTNDTMPDIFQMETTKAKRIRDVKIRFSIYSKKKIVFEHRWKANEFFDPKDKLSDTIKWLRLERILRVFFSNQNFSISDSEDLATLFSRVRAVDIQPGTGRAKEYEASPHKIFAVYAGREMLYGITWLSSEKKFVILWRN